MKIVVQEGEVEVGSTIAMIENGDSAAATAELPAADEAAEPIAAEGEAAAVKPESGSEPQAPAAAEDVPAAVVPKTAGGRIKASPLARRIARERGVDLAALAGTGPDGRIVAEDVENAPVGGHRLHRPPAPRQPRPRPTSRS